MRKILIITALMATICSCSNTNKEYCSACEDELTRIYLDLSFAYEHREEIYQKLVFQELDFEEFDKLNWLYCKYNSEIEGLEKDMKHYEMEIKKYSKKWEFNKWTRISYTRLDSVKTAIYGYQPALHNN